MTYEVLTRKANLADSILYYQIDIIEKHPEMPLLPVHVSMGQHNFNLEMDISRKVSLLEYLSDHELTREEWIRLLIFIGESILKGIDCFLDSSNFELSTSTIYFPSGREQVTAEDSSLLYIPVLRESLRDPIHEFCIEVMQFLSVGAAASSLNDKINVLPDGSYPAFNETHHLFSTEESTLITSWSKDHLEDGIANLRNMLVCSRTMDSKSQKSIRARFFKKTRLSILSQNSHGKPCIPVFFHKISGHYPVLVILISETCLMAAAFQIMRLQTHFKSPFTPILLLSSILFCFSILDLFLLFSKKSFLRYEKSSVSSGYPSEVKGTDSIFLVKEEKTVLLGDSSESRRIAMISAGIPGTLEESTGLKAYILADDFLIGRDGTKVDFKISSLSVGRIHARITRKENSFFIEDLGSRNGTFLDQKRLKKKEEYLLPENCCIRFAENEFYFVAN